MMNKVGGFFRIGVLNIWEHSLIKPSTFVASVNFKHGRRNHLAILANVKSTSVKMHKTADTVDFQIVRKHMKKEFQLQLLSAKMTTKL